ncbi:MAG: hypothetical protein HY222_04200 [Thaumarchaeota archaeon]|nr:hypothetical protein [Nitrososphaerota archaeon]MBI3641578.1 hypothetical protein [Nitrososphaerota archaeon]
MNSKTASLALHASKESVFSYLENIENLPKWATVFCKELKKEDGKYKVVTPMGELFFDIEADKKTGVIDMYAGPNERQMSIFPVRVLEMPGGASMILFTVFQTPGMTDEQFNVQYESLLKEFEYLKKEFTKECR